jgi:hypothetical protein
MVLRLRLIISGGDYGHRTVFLCYPRLIDALRGSGLKRPHRRGLELLLSRFIRNSMSSGRVARCQFLDRRIVSRNCLTGTEIARISAPGLPFDPLASSTFVFAGTVKPFASRDCIVPPQRGQCWLDQSPEASINC